MSRLKAARKELASAQDALAKLRTATNLDALDTNWIEFVQCLERSWNKVRAIMKEHSKWQGWNERGHIEEMRTSDPLVAYLRFARGVAEHGIADITHKQQGGWRLRSLSREAYIEKLAIRGGELKELKSPTPWEYSVSPARLELIPVKFRGVTYEVPTSHAGAPIASDPITVAAAGVAFYEDCFKRIDVAFP